MNRPKSEPQHIGEILAEMFPSFEISNDSRPPHLERSAAQDL